MTDGLSSILKACPKIQSFGHFSGIPYGLEQISKIGEETFETNLEEIFSYVYMHDDIDWKNTPDYEDNFVGEKYSNPTQLLMMRT